MKVLIISDLHLGDGTNADDFGKGNDNRLIQWIQKFKADMILLNGDIYELWQFTMRKIRKAHPELCAEFEKYKYVFLKGNHDYKLFARMARTVRLSTGKKAFISHGFQNDKMMTSPFARLGIWALTWLERFFPNIDNKNTYKRKERTEEKEVPTRTEKMTLSYAEKMLEKYHFVFCGHTHTPNISWMDNGRAYANSGACIHGKFRGILLDTQTDEIILV